MKKNMGSADQIVRIALAFVLLILFFSGTVTGTAGIALSVLAVVFLLTGIVGFCPLYIFFGINTCKR